MLPDPVRAGRYRIDGLEPWDIVVDVQDWGTFLSAPTRPDANPAIQVQRLYQLASELEKSGIHGRDRELGVSICAVTDLSAPAEEFAKQIQQSRSPAPDLMAPADTERVPWPTNWDGYEPFAPIGGQTWWADLSKEDAVRRCEDIASRTDERMAALAALTRVNGFELGSAPKDIENLSQWLIYSVEDAGLNTYRPGWESVVDDIAIFLGHILIDRIPHLHWTVNIKGTRRTTPHFQETVLGGFKNPRPGRADGKFDIFGAVRGVAGAAITLNELRPSDEVKFAAITEITDEPAHVSQ
ncbi:hypothetical protein [Mycobacteroides franklinii]|uniref:hypothetical protein n=1 Tax=Mycobacteroides franklinii TaxID=948102 RepID=UPI001F2D4155|nr:hypothetical protein [Mycobacteroides franklinii]